MCEGVWGRESDIGYCSAQNKDALGMKNGQSEAKIHKTRKGTKTEQAMAGGERSITQVANVTGVIG